MKRGGERQGTRWKSCWLLFNSVPRDEYLSYVPFDVFPFRDASSFAWWKFTGNLFITAIPTLSIDAKFLSINSSLEERSWQGGKTRIRREVSSTKFFLRTLIQRSSRSGEIVSRWDCFHLGFLLLLRRLFFLFFSLSREKRRNESIETNLFEKI